MKYFQFRRQQFFAISSYILALTFLTYEMALQVSPSVMTSELMKSLHVDAAGLGVVAAAYFYAYTLFQIPAGLLFDRLSTRNLIAASTLLCAVGTFLFAIPNSILYTTSGRFLMGLGSAFAFIGVLVISARWFSPARFPLLVGIAQLLAALGAMGGEAPLALAVAHHGWQTTAYALGWVGAGLVVMIFAFLRSRPDSDYAQIHGIPQLAQTGQPAIIPTLGKIVSNTQSWWIALYAFVGWAPITVFAALWGVPFLREAYHLTDAHAASYIGFIWIGLAIASPIVGWAAGRFLIRRKLMMITALMGLASTSLILGIEHLPPWAIAGLMLAFGVSTSGQILAFDAARSINTAETTATAIGFTNMANVAGGALFQPLVGWILSAFGTMTSVSAGVVHYSASSYRLGMLVVPTSFLVGYLCSLWFIQDTQTH